jgi:hypothetical protein
LPASPARAQKPETGRPIADADLPHSSWLALVMAPQENSWPMAGANPQRTSCTGEAIDPTRFVVEWYRPIEAYIPQNAQIVAANGLLYISSAGRLPKRWRAGSGGRKHCRASGYQSYWLVIYRGVRWSLFAHTVSRRDVTGHPVGSDAVVEHRARSS